jgi:hypothetical protein
MQPRFTIPRRPAGVVDDDFLGRCGPTETTASPCRSHSGRFVRRTLLVERLCLRAVYEALENYGTISNTARAPRATER